MFFASGSLKTYQYVVLFDRYRPDPMPHHYATPNVGHLPPGQVPLLPASVKRPFPVTCPPPSWVKAHTKLPILAAYPYLTVISISVARCDIRICG